MIQNGKKLARPIAARFMEAKHTGTRGIEVAFSFMEPSTGLTETLYWCGWIEAAAKPGETEQQVQERSRKNLERTMDVLVNVLGFNGNDTCNEQKILIDPNALAWGQDVHLTVENEEYKGTFTPKITWVNRIAGSGFGDSPETIKTALIKIGFNAAYLAAKQNKQIETELLKSEVPF